MAESVIRIKDLNRLWPGWRDKASKVDEISAQRFSGLGEGVWEDDTCPLQASLIVVTEKRIFRLPEDDTHYKKILEAFKIFSGYNLKPKTPSLQ